MPANMEVFEEDFSKYTDQELVDLARADGQRGLSPLDRGELYNLIEALADRLELVREVSWMYGG